MQPSLIFDNLLRGEKYLPRELSPRQGFDLFKVLADIALRDLERKDESTKNILIPGTNYTLISVVNSAVEGLKSGTLRSGNKESDIFLPGQIVNFLPCAENDEGIKGIFWMSLRPYLRNAQEVNGVVMGELPDMTWKNVTQELGKAGLFLLNSSI